MQSARIEPIRRDLNRRLAKSFRLSPASPQDSFSAVAGVRQLSEPERSSGAPGVRLQYVVSWIDLPLLLGEPEIPAYRVRTVAMTSAALARSARPA